MNSIKRPYIAVIAMIVLFALATLPGCANMELARANLATAQQTASILQQQVDEARARVLELEAGPEKNDALDELAKLNGLLAKAVQGLSVAKTEIAKAEDAPGQAEAVGKSISATLPPPWDVLAALAVTLGVGIWREVEGRKKGRVEVASAVERVKVNGVVDFNDQDTKTELTKALGPAGNKAVDIAQGKA